MNFLTSNTLIAHAREMAGVRPKILKNWFKRFNSENWLSLGIMIGLVLFFWLGGFFFFWWLAKWFHNIPTIGDILITRIIAFLFLALFMMTASSDLVTALSTMYLSRDLPLLHSYPTNPVSIFIDKYIMTVFYGAWAVVCFGIPIYFAYGAVLHAPWYFYPIAIISNIPFLIISAGVAILVTLLLAYILPANRARTMIIVLYGLSLFGVIMYIRLLGAQNMVGNDNTGKIEEYLFNLQLTTNPYFPSYWITQVYSSAVEGNITELIFYFSLLCISALFIMQISCQLAYKLYYPGWTKSCEAVQGTTSRKKWSLDRTVYRLFDIFPAHIRSVVVKDIKIFWRDLTQWGQLTLLITLVLVYLFNTRHVLHNMNMFGEKVFNIPLQSLIGIFNLALVGFVLANMAMRFVYTLISLEGRIIWVIRSSPIKLSTFFWIKYCLALFSMLVIGVGLIGLANYLLGIDWFIGLVSLISVVCMTIALTSIAMGLGALFPTFNVENPMQLTTGTGSILTVVSSLIYIIIIIFLSAQPMIPYILNGSDIHMIPPIAIIFPLVVGSIINFFVIYFPIRIGIRRLQSRER